jgi:GNAT superfamily N-acetyltransferase
VAFSRIIACLADMSSAPRTKLPCTVVPYEARFAGAFRAINLSWISSLFRVEAHDEATLSDPCALVAAGGFILVAVAAADDDEASAAAGAAASAANGGDDARVLGVVSLLTPPASGSVGLELAKMGVRDHARGRGVGRALGEAAVALARRERVRRLDILSNRKLTAALALYASLGFVERELPANDYERANIYLVLDLCDEGHQKGAAADDAAAAAAAAAAAGSGGDSAV